MNVIEDKKKKSNVLFYVMETKIEQRNIGARKYVTDTGDVIVALQEKRIEQYVKKVRLRPMGFLLIVILTACIGIGSWWGVHKWGAYRQEGKIISGVSFEEEKYSETIDENGFVFADSNKRYLSNEEIYSLKTSDEYTYQELLRYCINEIYARNGYKYEEGSKYWEYYNSYSWYREVPKRDVTYEMLNQYERRNIDKLVNIEKENGFR